MKKSAAELEKQKALASPYPNDLGPGTLDDAVLRSYPAAKVEGYKLMLSRCAQCHTPNRPLNSRFVEPLGKDEKERKAAVDKLKTSQPELFKDKTVWQVEWNAWNRYVHRMMNKPGCGVRVGGKMTDAEAQKIWEFLVYDGVQRKTGAAAKKWKERRRKLIKDFKTKYPARYKELSEQSDL